MIGSYNSSTFQSHKEKLLYAVVLIKFWETVSNRLQSAGHICQSSFLLLYTKTGLSSTSFNFEQYRPSLSFHTISVSVFTFSRSLHKNSVFGLCTHSFLLMYCFNIFLMLNFCFFTPHCLGKSPLLISSSVTSAEEVNYYLVGLQQLKLSPGMTLNTHLHFD